MSQLEKLRAAYEAAKQDNHGFNDDLILLFTGRAYGMMPLLFEAVELIRKVEPLLDYAFQETGDTEIMQADDSLRTFLEKLK